MNACRSTLSSALAARLPASGRRAAGAASTASGGFTLVEILVATSILLLIGGAVCAILLFSFRLWEHGVARSRLLAADDECQTLLSRDFASAVAGCGFQGEQQSCRFRTLLPDGERGVSLADVEYEATRAALVRRLRPLAGGEPSQRSFAVPQVRLAYGGRDEPPDRWHDEWRSPTNAPVRLRVSHDGAKVSHRLGGTHVRRTP